MKLNPIFDKEWLKLRQLTAAALMLMIAAGGYFGADLVGQFANIEPESMMWYRYSHLGDKPYWWVMPLFMLVAASVALCQFIPEVLGKKIRILVHLPLSMDKVISAHLIFGGSLVLAMNSLLAVIVLFAMNHYYPLDIVWASGRDLLLAQIPAFALYLGLIAVLVESDWRRKALKLIATLAVVVYSAKSQPEWQDAWAIGLLLWLLLPIKDSFLSVKTRRLGGTAYTLCFALIIVLLLSTVSARMYQKYATSMTKYYLFYSHQLQDYVYQRNEPNHHFAYGTASESLDKTQFENALPFVFWKNFDIQGKLPIEIGGKRYDKRSIRGSRLSLQYSPERLNEANVRLYPLFNAISNKGSIRFPENAFAVHRSEFQIYAAETAKVNQPLTAELNQLAKQRKLKFPIRHIWGKTTNMKPFDWGYFIQDDAGQLFNLRRADNQLSLTPVASPKGGEPLVYIQVSENRHKKFYGYAVSQSDEIYLLGYPDYQWIKLDVDKFNHQTMSFQLLADPLNYLLRFDDGKHYYAVRFDKQYQRLDATEFE